ncbi:MAG: hypothetical protein KOO62_00620 [candidate division Zixibacteria bacterium]|nr:hypothetical protein [candidate division Zixibacteria bacterium]
MKIVLLLTCTIFAAALLSCDDKESSSAPPIKEAGPNLQTLADWPFDADALFPDAVDSINVKRTESIQVMRLGEMPEFLGEMSDHYISYNCVGVAVTTFDVGGVSVDVQIAQCAELQDAYGLYASHRPHGVLLTPPGAESYVVGSTRYFTHFEYFITLSTKQVADSIAITTLAWLIDRNIESIPETPPFFIVFPYRNRIAASAHYYPYNYLGIPNFNSVYTIDYLSGGDTITVFLAPDPSGKQYISLRSYAMDIGNLYEVSTTIRFEGGHGLSFEHPQAGQIVAGLARTNIVGIVGYGTLPDEALLSKWVDGLIK